ncbi:phosphonate ABC transporter, permease protein PhnE [Desertimonas flava]|jgi:phosphonate transport system permease protein|uniref:phosphonate ABC transporter, permease protein PhnE n=1 Tax=Desertimonas flava TaxID=2064846 RepID=UPI000E340C3A|nr:phosphonate ABC transporter, permease protein PhnE [Desertimonas flava]
MTSSATPGRPGTVRPSPPVRWGLIVSIAVVVGAATWAITGLDVRWSKVWTAPVEMWRRVVRLMVENASWDYVGDALSAMWDSIAIAWLGTLFASVFIIPLGVLGAENVVGRWVAFGSRQVFNVLRAIPEIVLVLAVIPVLGLSKTAGVIAIGIGSIGTMSKLTADVIEGIDKGPLEAADATGAGRLDRVRWGVLPQAMPEIASFLLYRFEINIRVSAILGAVGAGGIGELVVLNLRFKEFGVAGVGMVVMIVITILVDTVSGAVRRRILAGPGAPLRGGPDLDPELRGELYLGGGAGGVG